MGHAMDWARDMPRQLGFIDWTGLILTPGHLINLHPQYGMAPRRRRLGGGVFCDSRGGGKGFRVRGPRRRRWIHDPGEEIGTSR